MMKRVIDFSYQAVNPFGIWDQADMTLYILQESEIFYFWGSNLNFTRDNVLSDLSPLNLLIDNLDTLKEGSEKK